MYSVHVHVTSIALCLCFYFIFDSLSNVIVRVSTLSVEVTSDDHLLIFGRHRSCDFDKNLMRYVDGEIRVVALRNVFY